MLIKIKKLHPDAVVPKYATVGSAGFDLVAVEGVAFRPGETALVKTGLAFEIPEGYQLEVRPRSGLSLNSPLRVANAPGTVDADYRGEVCVIMTNTSEDCPQYGGGRKWEVKKGDRVAQGVLTKAYQASFVVVPELSSTERGQGGFGHTGK